MNNQPMLNLFATVLTYPAPTANYRGESELNRSVIQKITDGRFEYPIISPEAMRNALREILRKYKLPMNRERLDDEDQLAVKFSGYPDPEVYADDHLFGYLIAANGKDRDKIRKETKRPDYRFKRDSVLRMNLAKGLEPYRHDAVFTQSPLTVKSDAAPLYQNAGSSALLHRETAVTAFQYPFALAGLDCRAKPDWVRALLKAVGELSGVAGNHARSYYEMAPASVTVRLTPLLVGGHDTYHFRLDGRGPENQRVIGSSLLKDLLDVDLNLPVEQFYLGGQLVRDLPGEVKDKLKSRGATLDADPRRLLATAADRFLGGRA
jgi:CRISPR-associated protein Cst2